MTVTNSNFTEKLFFLTYKSGIKDENNIDKVDDFFEKLNDLRTKDRTLLFNKQNLNDWKLKKHIPVMKNAVSLPILEAYLFTYKEFLIENSKSLFEQCVSHIKNLKKEYLNVLSSDSGGNIFFQGTKKKSAKINFLGERHSEDIKNLGHHIYGLYVSIRYRFNTIRYFSFNWARQFLTKSTDIEGFISSSTSSLSAITRSVSTQ